MNSPQADYKYFKIVLEMFRLIPNILEMFSRAWLWTVILGPAAKISEMFDQLSCLCWVLGILLFGLLLLPDFLFEFQTFLSIPGCL